MPTGTSGEIFFVSSRPGIFDFAIYSKSDNFINAKKLEYTGGLDTFRASTDVGLTSFAGMFKKNKATIIFIMDIVQGSISGKVISNSLGTNFDQIFYDST